MSNRKTIRPRPIDIFRGFPVLRTNADHTRAGIPLGKEPKEEEKSSFEQTSGGGSSGQKRPRPPTKKSEIPAPKTSAVDTYEQEQPADYDLPVSYIRFRKGFRADGVHHVDYTLIKEDEDWLATQQESVRSKLDADTLEKMFNICERASGPLPPLPQVQVETLFIGQLSMSRLEHKEVWTAVYNFWKQKRSKTGKPLLRRFWPVTQVGDTDPHKVFRPREKERYKLRRSRKNDMDSYRKMQVLKKDLDRVRDILELVKVRERLKQSAIDVQEEMFEQAVYDLIDTSGKPRPVKFKKGEFRLNSAIVAGGGERDEAGNLIKKKKKKKKDKGKDLLSAGELATPVLPSYLDELSTREPFDWSPWDLSKPCAPTYTPKGIEPVQKFVRRGRMGRGGRVVFDRVPVQPPKPHPQALGRDETRAPSVTVYAGALEHPFEQPPLQQLVVPFQGPHMSDRTIKELCDTQPLDDDQDELLEPTGLGAVGSIEPTPASQKIRYTIRV